MNIPQKSCTYITDLIKNLIPQASVIPPRKLGPNFTWYFYVVINNMEYPAVFNSSLLNDFEVLVNQPSNTLHYKDLESQIKFIIYMAFGTEGLLPNIQLSKEFLDEERDWMRSANISLNKKEKISKIFYEGLKELHIFLENTASKHTSISGTMTNECEDIAKLIQYYDEKQNFNENEVSLKSLQYLKAAALCIILNKEKNKETTPIPRIKKETEKEIYSIAMELRNDPFDRIKLPECIYDYAADFTGTKNNLEELVFIACGQLTEREKTTGINVKKTLSQMNIHAFFAEETNDLESLNTHIFYNLNKCTAFIAILHKRQENKYETSVWINQEIAIVAFLRSIVRNIPSLIFYEENLMPEGLIKYTIANPLKFKSDEDIIKEVEKWFQKIK